MKSPEIIRIVNDGSHRLVFARDSELWSVEQLRDEAWLPGVVVREFDGMAAMKDGALTALQGDNHVFFYPSLSATLEVISDRPRCRMCWLSKTHYLVAFKAIEVGVLDYDKHTDVVLARELEAATC